MSTAADPPATTTVVGLGYGIAIAISILVLISSIMLASYACIKVKTNSSRSSSQTDGSTNGANSGGVTLWNSVEPTALALGLDRPVIESYPKIALGRSRRIPGPNDGLCSICLCQYKGDDTVRCIPDCHHCFYADCVDEWLKISATCPMCRSSLAPSPNPTPLATPLSELVPLAFHLRWSCIVRFFFFFFLGIHLCLNSLKKCTPS